MDSTTARTRVAGPRPTDPDLRRGLTDEPFASYRAALERAAEIGIRYVEGLPERRVAAGGRSLPDLERPLGEDGADPLRVVDELAEAADPGLVAMNGPRYFGFVIGGTLPAAMAADWLASSWDQNAGMHITPAAATAERVAGEWLVDILGLRPGTSVGFTTGATTANLTCTIAARHAVLRRAGWDVEADGLAGAPKVTVVAGEEVHPSMLKALRVAGLGQRTGIRIPTDDQGRMRSAELARAVGDLTGPVIVLAQLGNVNTGALDPLGEIVATVRELPNAWLHVDGAFGLWAAASPGLRAAVDGLADVDSAATDAHKWLNTPYDTGLAFIADEPAVRAALSMSAAYLPASPTERDPFDLTIEMSRRARGFPVYAALRSLGRLGLAEMIDRSCAVARYMAESLASEPSVRILNDVVLNQVLVRFGEDDGLTREVIRRVQEDGTIWAGGTVWHGLGAMRISVSGWSTTAADASRSVEAIVRAFREARA
jgi:glutamate/tyrosine decarboxylase-like PLP-dependent enzyme